MDKYTNESANCSIFAPVLRIGRQIPHFEEVDLASVRARFSPDKSYRYLLELEYGASLYSGGRSKHAAVILKNPSAADERAADTTIRKVETYVYHHLKDVRQLSILNIFAIRATDAADLNGVYAERGTEGVVGPENNNTIERVANEADYLLVAWGNRSGINEELYEARLRTVKQLIRGAGAGKVFQVRGAKETVQPLHGMMWGYSHELEPYLNWKED